METIDLKAQLGSLIQLQAVDSELYSLQQEKESKPEEIKALESSFESKKQRLLDFEKTSLDLQKQKKEQELELAAKEESVKKLKEQLFKLKTNKEYQAMLQQINDAKADGSVTEDKILQIMDELDRIKIDVDKEKQELREEEKSFNAQKNIIQTRLKEIEDRLSVLEGQRNQIIPSINPTIFTQYERILRNRDGLAIVTVKNNSCQGCNMLVPPQVINLIRMYDHIVTCEMCNRILYIED